MKKVLYISWHGHRNIGDDLYPIAFPLLFPDQEQRFRASISDTDLSWADEVVIGGGNIINPFFLEKAKKVSNKPIHFYSVGCAAEINGVDLKIFDRIWVRDRSSYEKIIDLGYSCDLVPDAAWVLKPNRRYRMWEDLFESQGSELYEKRVVVVLNSHLTSRQPDILAREMVRWHSFADDLKEIIDNTSASFAFVPFGRQMPWDDRVVNSWVAHRCKWYKKNVVVWDEWGVQETMDFVGGANAMISMRLHSSIFGVMTGTPFLDITHHSKNFEFLKSVGLSGVDYWDFHRQRSQEIFHDLLENDEIHRRKLENICEEQRRQLLDYVGRII